MKNKKEEALKWWNSLSTNSHKILYKSLFGVELIGKVTDEDIEIIYKNMKNIN